MGTSTFNMYLGSGGVELQKSYHRGPVRGNRTESGPETHSPKRHRPSKAPGGRKSFSVWGNDRSATCDSFPVLDRAILIAIASPPRTVGRLGSHVDRPLILVYGMRENRSDQPLLQPVTGYRRLI